LIDRQGLQDRKLTHQLSFRDTLNWQPNGLFTAFRLTDQGHGVRIKADGNAAVGKVLAEASSDSPPRVKAPIGADAAEPSALGEIAAYLLQRE
jgi:hypothetical protein